MDLERQHPFLEEEDGVVVVAAAVAG